MANRTIANFGTTPIAYSSSFSWAELAIPSAADEVIAVVGSVDMSVDAASVCRSANFTNYVGTFSVTSGSDLSIGDATAGTGNIALKLVAGMGFSGDSASKVIFVSTSTTQQTIDPSGKTLGTIQVNGAGSSYVLLGALTLASGATLDIRAGTFDDGGFSVTCGFVATGAAATRVLTITGTWTLNGTGTIWGSTYTNMTLNASTSIINITDTSTSAKVFAGGGKTYGTVNITMGGTGAVTFSGSNSFNAINRSGTGTKTVKFADGTTTTLRGDSTAFLRGTAGNIITVTGSSTGGWTLSSATDLSCDYLDISYCTMTGGGKLYCGANSTNSGNNNANVIFTVPDGGGLPPSKLSLGLSL